MSKMEDKKYNTGFKVPDQYFEGLEDRLLDTIAEDNLPKSAGFKTPEGYFETFETRLEKRLSEEIHTTTPKVMPLYKRKMFLYTASIAAVFACIVSVVTFSSETSIDIQDINTEAIASYIDDGNLDISSQELALFLQEEDMNVLEIASEEISNENITDYLLNTIDDPTLFIE